MQTQRVSAHQLRNNLGEMLNRVYYSGYEIVVEKMGKPVAKITPIKPNVHQKRKVAFNPPSYHLGGMKEFTREDIYGDYIDRKFR